MIVDKECYNKYLRADEFSFDISTKGLKSKFLFFLKYHAYSERYILLNYLKILRRLEYLNNNKQNNFFNRIAYLFFYLKFRRQSVKLQINIPVNTLGEGALILHLGTIVINGGAKIGKNCILQPGVVIGQKDLKENVPCIGDNVYFGPGSMVIGKIKIGDNVIIAPNSVVIKDVPDNCTVSGVPAIIIKQNGFNMVKT